MSLRNNPDLHLKGTSDPALPSSPVWPGPHSRTPLLCLRLLLGLLAASTGAIVLPVLGLPGPSTQTAHSGGASVLAALHIQNILPCSPCALLQAFKWNGSVPTQAPVPLQRRSPLPHPPLQPAPVPCPCLVILDLHRQNVLTRPTHCPPLKPSSGRGPSVLFTARALVPATALHSFQFS